MTWKMLEGSDGLLEGEIGRSDLKVGTEVWIVDFLQFVSWPLDHCAIRCAVAKASSRALVVCSGGLEIRCSPSARAFVAEEAARKFAKECVVERLHRKLELGRKLVGEAQRELDSLELRATLQVVGKRA